MKGRRKFGSSIKSRLFLSFALILLIPSLTIGTFAYLSAKSTVNTELLSSATESVNLLNTNISHFIQPEIDNMNMLGMQINKTMYQTDPIQLRTLLLGPMMQSHPEISSLAYATPNGLFVNGNGAKMPDGYDARERPWFKDSMANKGKVLITTSYVSATTKDFVVGITKTSDDGEGVFIAEIKLDSIAKITKNIKVGDKGYVYVLDKNNTYMVHQVYKVGDDGKGIAINDTMFKSDSGQQSFIAAVDGKAKKVSFTTNPLTGWKLAATWLDDEVTQKAAPIFNRTFLVLLAAVILGAIVVYLIIRTITTPLKKLMTTTEKIAAGDLSDEVAIGSKDELGQLAASVNHMVNNLRNLISGVITSSQNVAAASQQISATTEEIASGSSAQAQAAQHMQELFSELSTAINSVAESAEQAAELADNTTSIAHDGGQIVKKSIESMNEVSLQMTRLEEDSAKIGDIIEVIDDIAEQTNLLALNAAIEAARAGEQGRGFAVVADEVRKLAERSAEATKQIAAIIKGMQDNTHRSVVSVNDGVNQSHETGQAFKRIVEMIDETGRKVTEIAAASQEQAAQSSEVMSSIENISSASQEAAAASEETAATSQSLAQLADQLNDSVSAFKIK
jgi:methyl-accepting chemotaxis protein